MRSSDTPDLGRLSLNQMTVERWSAAEAIDGCARAGLRWIGLWRHKVEEDGLEATARRLREAGVRCSSLCRGGMFPAATERERSERIEDTLRAVDACVALGTDTLVLVCGGLAPGVGLEDARRMVWDGVAVVAPYARERGVRLGIEPLHPVFCADRSVVVTLGQANEAAGRLNAALDVGPEAAARAPGAAADGASAAPTVGVVIDAYHVWWDPDLPAQIARAAPWTVGFHVNDWITPLPAVLEGRGMMGDGWIGLRALRCAVDDAGYGGPIECEIFNRALWDEAGDAVLERVKERYLAHV